jgi:Flp pilus assembly protein TadG
MTRRRAARSSRGLWSRGWRNPVGTTAVEFALIAPIFISIVLGIIQVAIVWFAKTELQSATETAARLVLTGQTSATAYNTQAKFLNALCANLPVIFQCSQVMISLVPQASISSVSTATPTLTYNSSGGVTNTFGYSPGTYGQIMVLQVLYQLPVVAAPLFNFSTQSNGSLLLAATVVFENEPQ